MLDTIADNFGTYAGDGLGDERTVTDTSATGGTKFYSVEIVKP